jgi:flagellar biosynthesis protein FliR
MHLALLDHFVLSQLFVFMMLFCRMGSAIMLFPGFGDPYVSVKVRLVFALGFSLLLVPLLQDNMPAIPHSDLGLAALMIAEITVGVAIGLMVRIIFSAMHVAGTLIALQASLSVASQFDLNGGGQSAVITSLLAMLSVLIFFELDMHHVLLSGMVNSYGLFPVGHYPDMGDMTEVNGRLLSSAFAMGVQLSAPHFVFGLILYLGGGIMARLMPQMQVFYVLTSPQVLLSFVLLIAVLSGLLMIHTDYASNALENLFDSGSP